LKLLPSNEKSKNIATIELNARQKETAMPIGKNLKDVPIAQFEIAAKIEARKI
jgi:hypothetical protein